MSTDAVVFNGLNALDFEDVRMNVVRIPEVSARITEAQNLWDKQGKEDFSFNNYLCSDNETFLKNIHLKSLAAAIVQVGLYERYTKPMRRPDFLVGCSNCDSALHVAVGKKSFTELVLESKAFKMKADQPDLQVVPNDSPVLSGISLTEFQAYQWDEEQARYKETVMRDMDVNKIVRDMIDDHHVSKLVNVGPGNELLSDLQKELALSEVQILESIDLDPMLSWFWPNVKRAQVELVI